MDQQGYERRAREYLTAAAEAAADWYDEEGNWTLDSKPAETRERFWVCFAVYPYGEPARADAIIRKGETARYGDVRFNIFDTNIAAALLVHYRDKMADDVREKLERLVRDGFSFKPGNRQPDYQFHGYNDNMPAKGTMGLVLGGELLDEAEAVEYGVWNLRQLRAMLIRRGINSEFNSPTYTPLTLHAMAEIAQYAESREARHLAQQIEERLWTDLAARFHPELGVLSGPYSRAYTVDTIAHNSNMTTLLWLVLGEPVNPSPMLLLDIDVPLVLHHMGDRPFNIGQMCWYACGRFHIPGPAWEMMQTKPYPFRAVATCEMGDAGPDFPARPCRIETVLHADFSVGTSSTTFCGGEQTMSYFVTYKQHSPVKNFRDVGTVFSKMLINGELPGTIRDVPVPDGEEGEVYSNSGEEDCTKSKANTITIQSGPTALVLTHPHLALGGGMDYRGSVAGSEAAAVSDLSEMVIFPAHFHEQDELIVGGSPRDEWTGTAERGAWICCRRGRLLIGIRPLAYSREFGPAKITLERANCYQIVRFTLYNGEARTFTRQELRMIFGGFVAEHANVDEYPSLQAFADDLAKTRFTDYYWTTRRVRYRRPALLARAALEMETSWSPGTHTPRFAAINGLPVQWPRIAIDDVDADTLPFIGQSHEPVPTFFPWKDFTVEWGDWPWAIGDREED